MSKIINKKQLDFLIESTLKEYSYQSDPHGQSAGMEEWCRDNYDHPDCASWRDQTGRDQKVTKISPEEREAIMKKISLKKEAMGDTCNECGGMMYEGTCNECGSTYMGEDLVGNQKVLDKNKNNKLDSEDFEMLRRGDKDRVGESVKDLAESVTKTFNPTFLTEDMDNFKKLINYRNK